MRCAVRQPLNSFHRTNVAATLALESQASAPSVPRFVFFRSVNVNGEATMNGQVFTEHNTTAPLEAYGRSKVEAEQGPLDTAKRTSLEVVIIRSPLVYGPSVKGNFASLIKLVKTEMPLPLGAVENRRSMIALDNLVNFTTLCSVSAASSNAKGQIFLVSDGEDVSTAELFRSVANAYGCKNRYFYVPVDLMDLAAQCARKSSLADCNLGSLVVDNSKARLMLGWHPPIKHG